MEGGIIESSVNWDADWPSQLRLWLPTHQFGHLRECGAFL
jgi:hypothetical protein